MNNIRPVEKTGFYSDELARKVYSLNQQESLLAFNTSANGLNAEDAVKRLKQFGYNKLAEPPKASPLKKFVKNFTHLMALLLWVGGIIGIIAQMPQLAIAIWMVNVINGIFSFWQEFRAEKATEALKKMLPTYARVLREGAEQKILSEELVPGDILILSEGDHISADCKLLEAAMLRTDQATLTGESRPVAKTTDALVQDGITYTELPNMVFAGTSVATGTGKALVVSTGMNTEFGKIAHLTQEMKEDLSPLQIEMQNATKVVTAIAVGIGVLFWLISIMLTDINLAESIIFSMGMIVAFVPEGMLPTVTLSLAMATQRMAKKNALVKKLSSVETLGCTTVICTDKTGTLTQNEMTVKKLWIPARSWKSNLPDMLGRILDVQGIGYEPEGHITMEDGTDFPKQHPCINRLVRAANLCNNSRLLPPENNTNGRWKIIGDPTEGCLRVLQIKAGYDSNFFEQQFNRIHEIPFESQRKRMSTIHLEADSKNVSGDESGKNQNRLVFVKGAPREILDSCRQVYSENDFIEIDDDLRRGIMDANDQFARDGLRVLAVAQRELPEDVAEYLPETVETDMVFLGLVAMMDPPRPEVADAVKKCKSAGIRIFMITGDYGLTAESIARKIGIVSGSNPRIINGFELNNLSDEELKEALSGEVIFARVAPENKLRVVSALQEMGNIVAVTGDGVNDAPALKKANIGVAMGISGSDVAKEAASMILADDNFASIINAIEEGRTVYSNIRKFCTYIFTSNAPEAVPFIIFAFSGGRIPLAINVMHVLSVDLGTDMIPALGLGAEPPEPGIMDHPPRSLNEHVIDFPMLKRAYLVIGLVQSLFTMLVFYLFYWTNGFFGQWLDLPDKGNLYNSATGIALAAIVMSQIGNGIVQRSERVSVFKLPLFRNRLLWIGILSEVLFILMIIYVPFFNNIIGTGPFDLKYWPILMLGIPLTILTDEIYKRIVHRHKFVR